MSFLLASAAAATALSGSFDCEIDEVAAVSIEGGIATASMIEGLPADALKFHVTFGEREATVDWPDSPIQAAGRQAILSTGPGAGMLLMVSGGPCLFTEQACASMLNFVAQPDGSLKLLITPTALSFDRDNQMRFPFLVSMKGTCAQGNPKS